MEGRPARPGPTTQRRVEIHEGLFPHLGESEGWLGGGQGERVPLLPEASGALCEVRRARAPTTVDHGEESGHGFPSMGMWSQYEGWGMHRIWKSAVGHIVWPTCVSCRCKPLCSPGLGGGR